MVALRLPNTKRVPNHGSKAEYDRHKCRCSKCREANTQYMRGYRAAKKAKAA